MTNTIPNVARTMKKCAACRTEKPVSEMKTCMHNQMHNYVCDSKCMHDFYNPPKTKVAPSPAGVDADHVEDVRAMVADPSPAGVDGLEVFQFDWATCNSISNGWPEDVFPLIEELPDEPLCRLSDATSIIDGLRGEVERLQRAEKNDAIAYKAAIERQGELRAERDKQAQRIGELEEERNYLKALQENAQLHIEGLISERDAVIKASEPIYQYGIGRGNWTDITKDAYDEYASRGGEWSVRVVYSAALSAGKEDSQ